MKLVTTGVDMTVEKESNLAQRVATVFLHTQEEFEALKSHSRMNKVRVRMGEKSVMLRGRDGREPGTGGMVEEKENESTKPSVDQNKSQE